MSRPRESDRCVQVRAIFGLWHAQSRAEANRLIRSARATAARIIHTLSPGQIALVTGPSGSGKSTLLRAIAAEARSKRIELIVGESMRIDDGCSSPRAAVPMRTVDLFDMPLANTLCVLAAAGLAEAHVFTAVPSELSQGQRDRLRLALALARAEAAARMPIVIFDEFAGVLDRTTAQSIAAALRRWTSTTRAARVICATSHDDLRESLRPDLVVEIPLMGPPRVVASARHRRTRGRHRA